MILILTCCLPSRDKKVVTQQPVKKEEGTSHDFSEKQDVGLRIYNTGPRGGAYQNAKGDSVRYTIFRVELFNDAISPLSLNLSFPNEPVALLPDSTVIFEVFLVPEKFTPDARMDVFNFGAKLEDLFESGDMYQFDLNTTILPNDQRTLYIGILLKSKIIDGVTRTKLFVEGQDRDGPFFKVESKEKYELNKSPVNLVYGVSVAPPKYHTLISCGQIRIEK